MIPLSFLSDTNFLHLQTQTAHTVQGFLRLNRQHAVQVDVTKHGQYMRGASADRLAIAGIGKLPLRKARQPSHLVEGKIKLVEARPHDICKAHQVNLSRWQSSQSAASRNMFNPFHSSSRLRASSPQGLPFSAFAI